MENLRKVQLYLLDELVEIFDRNQIEYFLDAGTLIGAVRHQGFIPWDDDIDLVIHMKDYGRALIALKEQLPPDIHFDGELTDVDLIQGTPLKLVYEPSSILELNQTKKTKIFIDLFIFSPTSPKYMKSIWAKLFMRALVTSRKPYVQTGAYKQNHTKPFILAMEVVKRIPDWFVLSQVKRARKKYQHEPYIAADYKTWSIIDHVHPVEKIYPLKKLTFEGLEYSVPNDVDDYLTIKYGDYMTIPDEDKRQGHHILECHIEKMPVNKKRPE